MKMLVTTGLYPPEIGGPATYTKMLEDHLPKRGVEVFSLSFSSVRYLPKLIRHIAYCIKVFRKGRRAHVIFAQDPVSVGLPSLVAAKLLGKKFIVRIPGDYAWEQSVQRFGVTDSIDEFQTKKYGLKIEFLRRLQTLTCKYADRVIVPSDYFNGLVAGWGVAANSITTIYNGLSFDIEPKEPKEIPEGRLLVSAGRLVPWKGFDLLIKIMPELLGWHLVIIGDGPEENMLKSQAKAQGVSQQITFTGAIPRDELLGYLTTARAFVLNTSFESFSYQIVEAMHAEVPVITTDVGSIKELITHKQEGVLLSPNDADAFASAIKSVDAERVKWNEMTNRAEEKAEQFSIEMTTKRLCEELKMLHV